jgi:hypothetical protein
MPIKKGTSNKVVSGNISELVRDYEKSGSIGASKPKSKGKAVKQAVAISLSTAGRPKKMKNGGAFSTVKKRDGNQPVKLY